MSIRLPLQFLVYACLIAFAEPASASVISGTFTGIATTGSFMSSPSPIDVSGSAVTGGFNVTSVMGATPFTQGPNSTGDYFLPDGAVTYFFTIARLNQTFAFGTNGLQPTAHLSDTGVVQSVQFNAGANNPHINTFISLTGPEGSLFTAVTDIASLHIGPGVMLESPINLSVFLTGYASVVVTGQTLTGQAVPEPPAWAIMLSSLIALTLIGFMSNRPGYGLTMPEPNR